MMAVSRQHLGEERLFFARFNKPEQHSLAQLQTKYDRYRRAPVTEIAQFRHQVNFSRLPSVLRRLAWCTLAFWPQKRANNLGTFGMTLSGYQGAYGTQILGPAATMLGVDPMPRKGINRILYTFDHRVIDGKPATDMLEALQFNLTRAISHEVKNMLIADGRDPEAILRDSKMAKNRRPAA